MSNFKRNLLLILILAFSLVSFANSQLVKANPHAPASVPADLMPRIITINLDGGSVDRKGFVELEHRQ